MFKKFRKFICAAALAGVSFHAQAQSGESYSFSLQQAVDFALQNHASVKNAYIDREIAHRKVNELIGVGLPQIEAGFDLQKFLDIPTTFIPGEFFDEESGTFIPVQFGQPYNATAGLTATQLVFDGSYLVGVQASKTYEELSEKTYKQTKIETAVAVSKAYYNVLVNAERMALLDANVKRVSKLKDDTKALYENGFVEKIDNDRIEVTYNNLVVEKNKTGKLLGIAKDYLKFQMGMNPDSALELTDKLENIQFDEAIPVESKSDFNNRIEYSILQTSKRLYELDLKRNRFQFLPSLVAYGSFSYIASRNEFNIFNPDFRWYPTSIIGAKITLPIFDGLQKHQRIQQSKLNLEKINNNFKMLEQGITLETKTAQTHLQNAIESLETQRKNRALAEEVVRVSKVKYDQGVGSNLEVLNAETSLKEAETNYYSALYDALIAKTDYAKARGTVIKN